MSIQTMHPLLGADIELFATRKTRHKYNVIGATTVIKEPQGKYKNINNDGMLIEVNPVCQTCRDNLYYGIKNIIDELGNLEKRKNFKIKLASIHNIPKVTFRNISQADKEMGCLPDINAYTGEVNNIPSTYTHIPFRTCGGHIHVGASMLKIQLYNTETTHQYNTGRYFFGKNEHKFKKEFKIYSDEYKEYCIGVKEKELTFKQRNIHELSWNRWINVKMEELLMVNQVTNPITKNYFKEKDLKDKFKIKYIHDNGGISKALINPLDTVKILDLFVAIPAVLMEQGDDPKLRRKLYGRSGAFRYTPYGLEYRVLSNFWMSSPPLMSLFMGLTRFAVNIMGGYLIKNNTPLQKAGKEAWDWLNVKENILKLRMAIDENEFSLAKYIYDDIIEPIFKKYPFLNGNDMPLSTTMHRTIFKHVVINGGYEKIWNPKNIKYNWNEYGISGWNSFVEKSTNIATFKINEEWEKFIK